MEFPLRGDGLLVEAFQEGDDFVPQLRARFAILNATENLKAFREMTKADRFGAGLL